VIEIAQRIEAHGIPVELTLVGCRPPGDRELPEWVHVEGFLSKRTAVGRARLAELFARSHFLVMPSNAEAYGLVYAEASAYGVPSVATRTGGVPTVVVDGETGILDDPGAGAESYAGRILALMKDRPRYEVMAHAAAARSAAMLNWDVAGREAVARIAAVAGVATVQRERPRRMALTPI
jgi:glycosyltransferase involved in cell wall biosynthesis